jgi:hypothetical protein
MNTNTTSWRDRIAGAILVAAALAAQTHWMGPAIISSVAV